MRVYICFYLITSHLLFSVDFEEKSPLDHVIVLYFLDKILIDLCLDRIELLFYKLCLDSIYELCLDF